MPDLKDELKKLQEDLAKQTSAADAAGAEAKAIRAKIEIIQRQMTEEDRLVQAVKAKQDAYVKEKVAESIATGAKSIRGALEAVEPGKADKIDAAIKKFNDDLAQQHQDVNDLATKADEAAAKVKPAEDKVTWAKKSFEDSFKLSDNLGKEIERAKALKAKMIQAEADSDLVAAYVYVKEASVITGEIEFPDAAAIDALLSTLRKGWDDKGIDLANVKKASGEAAAKYVAASKALTARDRPAEADH